MIVNMFQGRSAASLEALCEQTELNRLFDTTIPRNDAFAAATLSGQPLRLSADGDPAAWLFDALATEQCERTGRKKPAARKPRPFLM